MPTITFEFIDKGNQYFINKGKKLSLSIFSSKGYFEMKGFNCEEELIDYLKEKCTKQIVNTVINFFNMHKNGVSTRTRSKTNLFKT